MFITFEGPDGSGKSTQVNHLVATLQRLGYAVYSTREPGGTPIGDQIRSVLFDLQNTAMDPRTEILLFQASRAQHVSQVIRPRLERGELVLCDRFADSTLAYQGYGHCMDRAELQTIINFSTGGLQPDLTLLLDLPAEVGLSRREKGGDWNRLDAFTLAFHCRVRQGYLEMAQADPQRWVVLNAELPPAELQAQIEHIVLDRINSRFQQPARPDRAAGHS
ncbi:MAG TPA: dTMP kinase [Anaerolineales bacterium]|nr:dTMP kinase [Anaerolineales bacterium]